ncbi:MAG: glycosyltransferase family 4 protein [Patescibacteria group bacterium]
MRILIFSLAYLPFVGGAEVAIKEITDRLPEHEFELITVDLDGKQKKTEKIGNVLVRRIGSGKFSKYFYPWQGSRLAARLHLANNYDLVWAMMANQAGMAAARFKKSFPTVPFVLSLQEGDDFASFGYAARLLGPRFFRVFARADYCQAISRYLAKWGREMGFKGQIKVIPNGVSWIK